MATIAVAVIGAAIAVSIPIKRAAKAKQFAINEQNYADAFSLIESGEYQEGQDILSSYFETENALVTHSEKISDCYEKGQNYYDNYDFYEANAVLGVIHGFYYSFPEFYEESTKNPLSFSESEQRIKDEYWSLCMDTREYVDALDLAASILPDDDYMALINKTDGFMDMLNYCMAMSKYSEDGACVTEVYQLLQSAKNYSLAASFLKTNQYMQIIAKLEGTWISYDYEGRRETMTFSNGICHVTNGSGSEWAKDLYIHGDNLSTSSSHTAIMPLYSDLFFTDKNTLLIHYFKTDYGPSYDTYIKEN